LFAFTTYAVANSLPDLLRLRYVAFVVPRLHFITFVVTLHYVVVTLIRCCSLRCWCICYRYAHTRSSYGF